MGQAAIQARMAEQGADIVASTPAETEAFIRNGVTKWGEVVRANNIRAKN